MASEEQVHWHEGLFLQPHHLQRMQRGLWDGAVAERQLSLSYPYGIVAAEIAPETLANKTVRFNRLRVVMPDSGIEVDVPRNANLEALPVQQRFDLNSEPFIVYLGIPRRQETRPNAREEGGVDQGRPLYSVVTRKVPDENTGDNPQHVPVRRLNARLLLEEDDKTDLEFIPILRVMHGKTGVDVPAEDDGYIPPTLLLSGSRTLRTRVDALANMVETVRTEIIAELQRVGFAVDKMRVDQFARVLKLQALNRAGPRLRHLLKAPAATPFHAYLELRDLLSDLAALVPGRDPWAVADYDHDNLAVPFGELNLSIPPLLRDDSKVWDSLDFVQEGNLLVARLSQEQRTVPIEYFLAVKSDKDPDEVRKLVEDAIKFRVDSMAKLKAPLVVYGLTLHFEYAPPGLPAPGGVHFFKLQRAANATSQEVWNRIVADGTVALRFPASEAGTFAKITLYMIYAE